MPHPVAGQHPIVVPQPPLLVLVGSCLTQPEKVVDTSPKVVMNNSTSPSPMGKPYLSNKGFIIHVFLVIESICCFVLFFKCNR